jgi:hypothetical protein
MALIGLALVALTFSIVSQGLLLAVPFALLALALPPRRPVLVAVGAALLVLSLTSRGLDDVAYFERGWALLLGSWFVVFVLALPAAGYVARGISAVAATVATVGVFYGFNAGGFVRLDAGVRSRYVEAATKVAEKMAEVFPPGSGTTSELPASMMRVAESQALVFPALLAIASLASLAAGWWLFRRFSASAERPLRPLREFRFSDHLVWVLLLGTVLMLATKDPVVTRVGANLVVFMAALYALRGLAVLVVMSRKPGAFGMVVGGILFLYVFPVVLAAAMIVGLTDTWFDIRAKRPIMPAPGS